MKKLLFAAVLAVSLAGFVQSASAHFPRNPDRFQNPQCHQSVPDAASTSVLLGLGLAGLATVRRFLR